MPSSFIMMTEVGTPAISTPLQLHTEICPSVTFVSGPIISSRAVPQYPGMLKQASIHQAWYQELSQHGQHHSRERQSGAISSPVPPKGELSTQRTSERSTLVAGKNQYFPHCAPPLSGG